MSFFVTSTPAARPKTEHIRIVSLSLVGVLVVMAVAQLFTFEDFPKTIADMWLPGGMQMATILAAGIVTLEVIALPFLLMMRLSPAMRIVSMVAGWVAIATWFVITLLQNVSIDVIANNGLLGATVPLPVGWWTVLFCIALGVLAGWASWGMWPIKRRQTA